MKPRLLMITFGLLAAGLAADARAELIELADGRVLHGKILPGETSESGLAVEVFDTGGVVLVRWDHVLATRAKKLRVEYGIDLPEEEGLPMMGHEVTLTTGIRVRGVALNPEGTDALRLKTPTGEKSYPRVTVGAVEEVKIDALEAYTPTELYEQRLQSDPPESGAAHFEMGDYCMRLGDYDHAKTHFEAVQADEEFMGTPAGKALDTRLRRAEVLSRARGAQEIVQDIKGAMYRDKWNDALAQLNKLDEDYKDEQIRSAVNFGRLENQVVKGRDKYFRSRVQINVYKAMDTLTAKKARERKSARRDDDDRPGVAVAGTLGAARQWAARELAGEIWSKVASDLDISAEEVDRYWQERSSKKVRTATYGKGSFIVIKKATLPKKNDRRRPPGARRRGDRGAGPQKQEEKPLTDEEWWERVGPGDRAKWLTADFVEGSGLFEIIRADESDLCSNCAGRGFTTSSSSDGGESNHFCVQCNGSGKFRMVKYR